MVCQPGQIVQLVRLLVFESNQLGSAKRPTSHLLTVAHGLIHLEKDCYLCSISCFISMPCFSRSSLWAKAQSTGSTGVSAHGVLSLSCRACSGSLKRNTWLLPMMIRLPAIGDRPDLKLIRGVCFISPCFCLDATGFESRRQRHTRSENDRLCHSFPINVSLSSFAGLQDHCSFSQGICATCEDTVLVLDEVTTQDNVLSTAGILTADPREKKTMSGRNKSNNIKS